MKTRTAIRTVDVILNGFKVLGVLVVVGLFAEMFVVPHLRSRPVARNVKEKNLQSSKFLVQGCNQFAAEHGGRYPVALRDLAPEYISPGFEDAFSFREGRDGDRYLRLKDWQYFGTGFDASHPPRLLIASPQEGPTPDLQTRVALDATGKVVKDDKYDQALADTMKRIKALPPSRQLQK
jgi:hypothetical protein